MGWDGGGGLLYGHTISHHLLFLRPPSFSINFFHVFFSVRFLYLFSLFLSSGLRSLLCAFLVPLIRRAFLVLSSGLRSFLCAFLVPFFWPPFHSMCFPRSLLCAFLVPFFRPPFPSVCCPCPFSGLVHFCVPFLFLYSGLRFLMCAFLVLSSGLRSLLCSFLVPFFRSPFFYIFFPCSLPPLFAIFLLLQLFIFRLLELSSFSP